MQLNRTVSNADNALCRILIEGGIVSFFFIFSFVLHAGFVASFAVRAGNFTARFCTTSMHASNEIRDFVGRIFEQHYFYTRVIILYTHSHRTDIYRSLAVDLGSIIAL